MPASCVCCHTSRCTVAVYCDEFEVPFLERTAEFYAAEAAEYIASCDCPAYLAHAERRLGEEVERVAAYLDPSTEAKVVKVRHGLSCSLFVCFVGWSRCGTARVCLVVV